MKALKIYYRVLTRNKVFSFISIGGFSISLAVVIWIVQGILAGIPLGWYFMQKRLSGFAYKTTLDWWIFGITAMASASVAILTVSWQTWRAARRNPVEALRFE